MPSRDIEAHRAVGRRLAEARREAGLSQRDLADKLNRPRSYIAKLEVAERRLDLVDAGELASALGLRTAMLVARLLDD